MIALPERVVGRTTEIDEELLTGAEIGVQPRDACRRDLRVVHGRDEQRRTLHLGGHRLVPAPRRRVRRAADTGAPRRRDRIGREHVRPDALAGGRIELVRTAELPIPVRVELLTRLRVERRAGGRHGRGGGRGRVLRVRRGQQDQFVNLVRMLRRVTAGPRPAERPADEADLLHTPQGADVLHDGVDVVPVGREGGRVLPVAGFARRGKHRRHEQLLLRGRKVARIVHDERPRRSPVPRHVHRKHVEPCGGEKGHPAVVLIWHVEGDLGGRPGAVDEEDDPFALRGAGRSGRVRHALTHVELRGLARNRGHGRANTDVVIDRARRLRTGADGARGADQTRSGGQNCGDE